MTHEPTTADSAEWAKNALAVFTAKTFAGDHPDTMDRGDLECAVSDLITDLMHYARQQGFDTGSIMQRACGHFGAELLEETLALCTNPLIVVVSVRGGLVQEARANGDVTVIVKDWDCQDQQAPATYNLPTDPLRKVEQRRLVRKFNLNNQKG